MQAGVFIWEIFHPSYRDLADGPARLLIYTHRNFYEGKSGEARSRKPSQRG